VGPSRRDQIAPSASISDRARSPFSAIVPTQVRLPAPLDQSKTRVAIAPVYIAGNDQNRVAQPALGSGVFTVSLVLL
jgi:hypothetical protein